MWGSVAPSELSMPRPRTRRWASTVKPATDTRPTKTSPTMAMANTSTAGGIPTGRCGATTVAASGQWKAAPPGAPASESTVAWPGAPGLPGGDEGGVDEEVLRVLAEADQAERAAGFRPAATGPEAERGRQLRGHGDLARAARIVTGDQGERRPPVGAVRILGSQLCPLD